LYFDEKIAFSSGAWRKEKIKIVPPKDASGSYQFQVKVLNESGGLYGREQILRLIIKETSSNVEIETLNNKETKEQILPENETVQITKWVQKNTPAQKNKETTDCLNDFSCDDYFVYLPLGEWSSQALFEARARERAAFFEGISDFKFKKVGNIFLPLNFVKDTCKINSFGAQSARDHLLAKRCADRFVDKLGISYEKVIALSSSMAGGYAFIKGKSVYTTLGYIGSSGEESPSIVAHELGHAYSLCDEYDFKIYEIQNRLFGGKKCRNKFPNQCSTNTETCLGNTPTYRDYEGQTVQNVCLGQQHYSVMGYNQGYECGYDATGGYEAVKN
ncbi:hypothetical protein HYU21_00835, partial [Candidatus Woesearchaeota archaeon]|nr:hypothetical protein [Candidatus Woesearchaeota archaeon]